MKALCLVMIIFFLQIKPAQSSVTEEDFEILAKEFIQFIVPLGREAVPQYKKTIKLIRDNLEFGAWEKEPMEVNLGLLISEPMNIEAVAFVMCHEIGHNGLINKYYLPEGLTYGQWHLKMDYFASYACIIPFLKSSRSFSRLEVSSESLDRIPLDLQTKCETHFHSSRDARICLRAIDGIRRALDGIYEAFPDRFSNYPRPSLERDWLGAGDELQGRMITSVNGIFHELPFDKY